MVQRPTCRPPNDAHPPKKQVQQRSTVDVLSILEKVDNRLASLERYMAPIRRVCMYS